MGVGIQLWGFIAPSVPKRPLFWKNWPLVGNTAGWWSWKKIYDFEFVKKCYLWKWYWQERTEKLKGLRKHIFFIKNGDIRQPWKT